MRFGFGSTNRVRVWFMLRMYRFNVTWHPLELVPINERHSHDRSVIEVGPWVDFHSCTVYLALLNRRWFLSSGVVGVGWLGIIWAVC